MIPFSILSGQLLSAGEKIQEVSILDVSRIGFTFRLPRQWHGNWDAMELHVYCRRDSAYRVIVLHDVLCEMEQETEFLRYIASSAINRIINRLWRISWRNTANTSL